MKALAERISESTRPIVFIENEDPEQSIEILNQICFAGTISILEFLQKFTHPVTIETLSEVSRMEKIDIQERIDWLLEKQLVEKHGDGFVLSPDFKVNMFPYRVQIENRYGSNLLNIL